MPRLCVVTPGVIRNRPARRCHARVAIGSVTAHRFRFPVVRDRGWNFAEVTAGGIPRWKRSISARWNRSWSPARTWSERCSTATGRIGGFNFQWAWATGRVAGRAAALSLNAESRR